MSFFPGGSSLFREGALRRGDMRESLDQRVRVVGVARWIRLALGILVVLGFLAWAESSEIETSVDGTGVLSSVPPLAVVEAPVAGTVAEVAPAGPAVQAGAVVARIHASDGRTAVVRSFVSGTVTSVAAPLGSVVSTGEGLVTVEPAEASRAAYVFVPLSDAAQVEVGQEVLLSASVEESQATTLLKGRVEKVSPTPASPAELERILGPALGPRLARGPLLVEVLARLPGEEQGSEGQATGSAAESPPRLALGAPLTGRVIVSRRSPLDFVF